MEKNAFEECDTLKLISVSKPFLKDKIGIHKTAKIIYNDNELDFIYEFARILKKEGNKKEAFYFFKLAADKGHVDSMFQYGSMNYSGDYIPVNKKEAFKYFQLAADNGHAMAMHYIGYMYSHGESVEVDINKASTNPRLFPSVTAQGSIKQQVPSKITHKNVKIINT